MHRAHDAELKGIIMAAEPATTEHSQQIEAHARDYSGFVRLFKWGAILSFITAMVVIFIISN